MGLSVISPGDAGLDSRRLAVAVEHIASGQREGVYSAAVFLVARRGRIACQHAFGTLTPNGRPTQVDSIFDLASVTKPHVATALLTLVEDGKVSLSGTVPDYLPEAQGSPLEPITIRQLATHSSGLPPWKALYKAVGATPESPDAGPAARQKAIADILQTPLRNPPGTKYAYSDLGYMLIGEVVTRTSGMALDEYVHSRVLAPLGMRDTGYRPGIGLRERIAATANSGLQGGRLGIGEVHDENARSIGGVSGHAGLFGTAPDLAILASALAANGEAGGHRVLGVPTLRLARTRQIDAEVGSHSIGWFTAPNPMLPRGDILGDTAFGHTGFTGTLIVVDPAYELAVILLTNRVINPADGAGIARVRRRVLNAAASAIIR